MKISFIGSICGKDNYEENYKFITDKLKSLGHDVIDNGFMDMAKTELAKFSEDEDFGYYRKIFNGLKKADVVVAEVSNPSTSIGYIISLAVEFGKPVIALNTGEERSHLLVALDSYDKFTLYRYKNFDDLEKELPLLLEYASDQQDTRFNFFISPKHQNYLDWVSKNKKIPRSVYLRDLIENSMEKDEDYMKWRGLSVRGQ